MDTPAKLASSYNVEVDGIRREIFMSFALLNRLAYLLGNPDNVVLILMNPEMREAVLIELLAERDSKGKLLHPEKKALDEYAISFEAVQGLLEFASEHVLDFTLAATERSQSLQEKNKARLAGITSRLIAIQTGLPNKTS